MTADFLLPPLVDRSAEPTSALSEWALIAGYAATALIPEPSSMVRSVPCACGGRLDARAGEEAAEVAVHIRSTIHRQWRAAREES